MTASALPTTTAERVRWLVSDISVMTWRNLLRYVRLPQLLAFSTVQPAMFVVLFRYVFGGAIPTGAGDYADFLVPGILAQSVLFGASQTAVGLATDVGEGAIERFRSLPMARSAVLAGRTLADSVRNVFVMILLIGVGYLVGFDIKTNVLATFAALGLLLLFGFAFSWVEAAVGLTIKDPETTLPASFVWLFPLMFASSMFVPPTTMPDWLRFFAEEINPVSSAVDAARALLVGGPAAEAVSRTVAWSVGLLVLFVPISVRQYRKAV